MSNLKFLVFSVTLYRSFSCDLRAVMILEIAVYYNGGCGWSAAE